MVCAYASAEREGEVNKRGLGGWVRVPVGGFGKWDGGEEYCQPAGWVKAGSLKEEVDVGVECLVDVVCRTMYLLLLWESRIVNLKISTVLLLLKVE